jgi:hypothetical protein
MAGKNHPPESSAGALFWALTLIARRGQFGLKKAALFAA